MRADLYRSGPRVNPSRWCDGCQRPGLRGRTPTALGRTLILSYYKGKVCPVLSLCQNFISHFDSRDFPFLTPARTSTLVATTKICIELLDCRTDTGPSCCWGGVRTPRDLLWRGGACFLGWSGVLCSRLAGSVPKSLHTPPPCNECPST